MHALDRISDRAWAGALAGMHLILALFFCFVIFPRLGWATSGLDPDGYGRLGQALYETGRYQSIDKPPLYPAFVAVVSTLAGGYRPAAVQIAQCLLSGVTVACLYALFRRTLPGRRVAQVAGLTAAVYPLTLWYTSRLWTETLLTFWIAVFMLALVRTLQSPARRTAILCGAAAGCAALTKGMALILIPLALVMFLRRGGRQAAWFGLAVSLILLPVLWRLYHITGTLLPVHAEGGYNFYIGNGFARHWPQAPLSYTRLKDLTEAEMPQPLPAGPLARDQLLLRLAWEQLTADPLMLPRKLLIGGLTFWYLAADAPQSLLTAMLQIPIVLLAGWGQARRRFRRNLPAPLGKTAPSGAAANGPAAPWLPLLLLPVLGFWAVGAAVLGFGRLSAPVMTYVIALAAAAVWPMAGNTPANKKPDGPATLRRGAHQAHHPY